MRIAALARRVVPCVPGRAGVPPVWDRPDPPATGRAPIRTHRMTMEESHNYFFDASSPIYNIVNSQVAEGDLLEASPRFFGRWLLILGLGLTVGSLGYLFSSKADIKLLVNYEQKKDMLNREDRRLESKQVLNDLKKNPWKLNSWPEFYPHYTWGKVEKTYSHAFYLDSLTTVRKINSEGRAYWAKLREESEKEIAAGAGHH